MIRTYLYHRARRSLIRRIKAQERSERAVNRYLDHVTGPVDIDDRWLQQGKEQG